MMIRDRKTKIEDKIAEKREERKDMRDTEDTLKKANNLLASEQKKAIAKFESKRYIRNTLLTVGIVYIFNAVLLYAGTIFGENQHSFWVNITSFYGLVPKNVTLQRTAGMLCFMLSFINFCAFRDDNLITYAVILDIISFIHFLAEAFFYKQIRAEIIVTMGFFLLVNVAWVGKEWVSHTFYKVEKRTQEATPAVAVRSSLS